MCLRGLLVLFLGLVFLLPVASLPSLAPSSSIVPIACASILPAAHVQNAPLEKPALGCAGFAAPRASIPLLMMAAKCVFTRAKIQIEIALLSLGGSGHVGIGTTSPAAMLDVYGTIDTSGVNGLWQDATNFNLAVGATALPSTISQSGGGNNGQHNTAVGYQALNANTTGFYNTAVGNHALNFNTTGYYNTAVGSGALGANTTGYDNTAVGLNALNANTTGYWNTALGHQALSANTTGQSNTAVGLLALGSNTTGAFNAALGFEALYANTTGQSNTALGHQALYSNTTATGNVAIGYDALWHNTTGGNNTVIGNNVAFTTLNAGSNNILIGTSSAVDTAAAGTNYNLNIGNLLQGDMTNSTALGKEVLFLQSTASSVDYLQIAGGATGSPGTVTISGQGTDSNVNIAVTPKGAGSTNFTGNVGMVFTTPDFREAQASTTAG